MQVQKFTFNPFQENTYVVYDETKMCIIIDPGCYDANEQQQLTQFIESQGLTPVAVVNTHCHIDHIFGIRFCTSTYGIDFICHEKDVVVLESGRTTAQMYGLSYLPSPDPHSFITEGENVNFGNSSLEVRFTPGHSPGSVCFVAHEEKFVIGGDVLFRGSIGRTDLPGGDFDTLIQSIRAELFTLPDAYTVYSGHGEETTIGFEKQYNPFLNGQFTM